MQINKVVYDFSSVAGFDIFMYKSHMTAIKATCSKETAHKIHSAHVILFKFDILFDFIEIIKVEIA